MAKNKKQTERVTPKVVIEEGEAVMIKVDKPCHKLHYCPYGPLVEDFPLEYGDQSCDVFGHDCPVFYVAEGFVDGEDE